MYSLKLEKWRVIHVSVGGLPYLVSEGDVLAGVTCYGGRRGCCASVRDVFGVLK